MLLSRTWFHRIMEKIINSILRPFNLQMTRISKPDQALVNIDFCEEAQDFSLVLIGAHSGLKTQQFVFEASLQGKVCLVEPTPHLFAKLQKRWIQNQQVTLVNKAVYLRDSDEIDFYSMDESANLHRDYGDQLGSFNPEHAESHVKDLKQYVQKISVTGISLTSLFEEIDCRSIDILFLDTEGYDCMILNSYDFAEIKPKQILFEHKHSDGVNRIGKNFADLVRHLEKHNYRIQILDDENALARLLEPSSFF